MAARQEGVVEELPAAGEGQSFLEALAERVRTMRNRRGMSRKALAGHARVSERYLAQLEAGKGNISVLLLRRVSRALSVPLGDLLDDRPERPYETALLQSLLARLTPDEAVEARDLLNARFAPLQPVPRHKRIALIGLRGGGKSTLGLMLANHLDLPFVELDQQIVAMSGLRLAEIFEMFGQETFRRTEHRALEAMLGQTSFVLATGGSLVTEPATFELLLASCLTVWVRATPVEHMNRVMEQGDLRPMAENKRAMDDLVSILQSREPLYRKADIILNTADRTPEQSLRELIERVGASVR